MMMRSLAVLAFFPFAVAAQDQQQATPETRALGAMVVEGAQREASLRAQIFTLQAEVERLKTQTKVAEAPKP